MLSQWICFIFVHVKFSNSVIDFVIFSSNSVITTDQTVEGWCVKVEWRD
jgi:hypothetical protein